MQGNIPYQTDQPLRKCSQTDIAFAVQPTLQLHRTIIVMVGGEPKMFIFLTWLCIELYMHGTSDYWFTSGNLSRNVSSK